MIFYKIFNGISGYARRVSFYPHKTYDKVFGIVHFCLL